MLAFITADNEPPHPLNLSATRRLLLVLLLLLLQLQLLLETLKMTYVTDRRKVESESGSVYWKLETCTGNLDRRDRN